MVERTLFAPGGATEDKQDEILVSLLALLTELQQKLEPGGEVALNAATLAALETINAIVTGSVSVTNFPATQPVSGPLTDAQLRAAAVPVLEGTGLVPKVYDFIDLGYDVDDNLDSVVYKSGGSGGTIVATLALTYAGGLLNTVVRT